MYLRRLRQVVGKAAKPNRDGSSRAINIVRNQLNIFALSKDLKAGIFDQYVILIDVAGLYSLVKFQNGVRKARYESILWKLALRVCKLRRKAKTPVVYDFVPI